MTTYLNAARAGADWLLSLEPENGGPWPAAPEPDLYDGMSGVALALLDAHRTTGDGRYLAAANRAADAVAEALPGTTEPGLYTGLAGMAFALSEFDHASAEDAGRRLATAGRGERDGTDIIFGAAGAGLVLLDHDLAAATSHAEWLLDVSVEAETGRWWPYIVGENENMPNFSHGTSGVAYFLASVAHRTGDERFLDGALAGMAYLLSIARQIDDTIAVPHEPGSGDYPLGWCHGPTGLARSFERLSSVTGDPSWAANVRRAANTIRTSGIPERAFPGFWDNVSPCCGSTRVAELFLDLHRTGGTAGDLAFCRVIADDIVARATIDDAGTRWSNVEFRLPEPALPPSASYMQGNSGIIAFLFRLHRFLSGDDTHVAWPDSPW
jgi:lantibiotic modifying enzyme